MSQPATILFLYGSLKRGRENHHLIADQEFLGEATTDPAYRIIDLGRYPGLIRDDADGLAVRGELWRVSRCCLAELDDFEEAEGLWKREPIAVAGQSRVGAYFWIGPVPENVRSGREWPLTRS